ncbi:MAG: hypothetical protein MJY77_05355 [Bacteroidaceae bacterium]|nr:hypothetical protein [Bacteroidaceae bacterium]
MIDQSHSTRHFIIKGNEQMINHVRSINELGCLYWRKSHKNLELGDTVYLFITKTRNCGIRYRLTVTDIDCERKDSSCWNVPFIPDKHCYKFTLDTEYKGIALSLNALNKIGISPYVMFKQLNPEQVNFIDNIIDMAK